MDQALMEAIQRKEIDPDDAFRFASDKGVFQRFISDTSVLPRVSVSG
jgi:twitching motility protein PilT